MAMVPSCIPSKWTTGTPSDSTDLTGSCAIRADVAGTLVVRTIGANVAGQEVTVNILAGGVIDGQFTRLMAASTATGIQIAWR